MLFGRIFLMRKHSQRTIGYWKGNLLEWVAISLLVVVWCYLLKQQHLYLVKTSSYLGDVISKWLRFSGYSISFAIFIYAFARSKGMLARLMSTRIMIYLGEISYSLYMCHALAIQLLKKTVPQTMAAANGMTLLLVAAVSLLASVLLYQLVEHPAKVGLLAVYQKRCRMGMVEVIRLWRDFFTSPLAWWTLGLSFASWLVIKQLS
jgi:peptidoglycan/LPS O-acetylase OafA/YrhL